LGSKRISGVSENVMATIKANKQYAGEACCSRKEWAQEKQVLVWQELPWKKLHMWCDNVEEQNYQYQRMQFQVQIP